MVIPNFIKILILLVIAFLLDKYIAFLSIQLFGSFATRSDMQTAQFALTRSLLLYGLYVAITKVLNGATSKKFHLHKLIRDILIGVGVSSSMLLFCLILTPEFYEDKSTFSMLPWSQVLMLFCSFVSVGILEEVIYRGILQKSLSKFLPIYIATAIQIALFVVGHWPSILGHSSPAMRIMGLTSFAILATLMAKHSPYLVMPIAYHTSENLLTTLIRGLHDHGRSIQGIWSYQDYLRIYYRPWITLAICGLVWYCLTCRSTKVKS